MPRRTPPGSRPPRPPSPSRAAGRRSPSSTTRSTNQGLADSLAKAVADQVASSAYEATALVDGSPKLKSGVAVTVSKVDPMLAGDWVITTARHEFGNGPYRTHLEFSRSPGSVAPWAGCERADVEHGPVVDHGRRDRRRDDSLDDPDKLGRVKVKYPWLGDDAESHWARVARPSAGTDYGFLWFPEFHEEVARRLRAWRPRVSDRDRLALERRRTSRPPMLDGRRRRREVPDTTHRLAGRAQDHALRQDPTMPGSCSSRREEGVPAARSKAGRRLELYLEGRAPASRPRAISS